MHNNRTRQRPLLAEEHPPLTIGSCRDGVAVVIKVEIQLGVVQPQGAVGSSPRPQMPCNAVQSKHIINHLLTKRTKRASTLEEILLQGRSVSTG